MKSFPPCLCHQSQTWRSISTSLSDKLRKCDVDAPSVELCQLLKTSRRESSAPFHSNGPSRALLFCIHTSHRILRLPHCNLVCSYSIPPLLPSSPVLV